MVITACVITWNEERHIAACLASLRWAGEVLVVDSFSEDRTVEIARRHTARLYQRAFRSFPAQRNVALDLAQGEWVLFVDADERVTPELAAEVMSVCGFSGAAAGYWVPRRNIILGKWMQHTGWYPDYQLRLLRRQRARYGEGQEVHEVATLDGPAAYLANPLVHYNYERLRQFLTKQDLYAGYAARSLFGQGLRPRPHNFLLQPWREFRRRYLALQGYKDGGHGLLLSLLLAYYSFATYAKLAALWKAEDGK